MVLAARLWVKAPSNEDEQWEIAGASSPSFHKVTSRSYSGCDAGEGDQLEEAINMSHNNTLYMDNNCYSLVILYGAHESGHVRDGLSYHLSSQEMRSGAEGEENTEMG